MTEDYKTVDNRIVQECASCSHVNELPFVLCDRCGAPRGKLGRFRVTFFLMIVFSCFMGTFVYRETQWMPWHWPLYFLYSFFFTQFTVALTRGRFGQSARVWSWCIIAFSIFMVFFHFLNLDEFGKEFYTKSIADTREKIEDNPPLFIGIIAGVIAGIFIPAFLRWAKHYGWVNAYRVVLIAMFFLAYLIIVAMLLTAVAYEKGWLNNVDTAMLKDIEKFVGDAREFYIKYLLILAERVFQVFLFEIFVFSAVKGYAITRHEKHPEGEAEKFSSGATGLTKSVLHFIFMMKRFMHMLENMARYLLSTLIQLGKDLGTALFAFLRELLVPVVTLVIAAVVIYRMSDATVDYVVTYNKYRIIELVGGTGLLLLGSMLFIGCKAHFRWKRIVLFYMNLVMWLLPNLMLFFLLLSVTFFFSSRGINRLALHGTAELTFRLGIMTQIVAGFLVVLVFIIYLRKKHLLFKHPDHDKVPAAPAQTQQPLAATPQTGAAPAPTAATAAPPQPEIDLAEFDQNNEAPEAPEMVEGEKPQKKKKGLSKITNIGGDISDKAKSMMEKIGLDTVMSQTMSTAKDLSERFQGKPKVIDELSAAKNELEDKERQIEALEKTQDKISKDVYEGLRKQYDQEILSLAQKHNKKQSELDKEYSKHLVQKSAHDAKLTELEGRVAEFEALLSAGAITQDAFKKEKGKVQKDLDSAKGEAQVYSKMVEFLQPYVSDNPE